MSASIDLAGFSRLSNFFGCELPEVNRLNQLMIIGKSDWPEWLRGKPKVNDLPRKRKDDVDYPHVVPHILVPPSEIAQQARWIVENLYSGWNITQSGFSFECETEAVMFKLAHP